MFVDGKNAQQLIVHLEKLYSLIQQHGWKLTNSPFLTTSLTARLSRAIREISSLLNLIVRFSPLSLDPKKGKSLPNEGDI